MSVFREPCPLELGQVASGFIMQGLWRRNEKVESQVVGVDRCQLSGKSTVGKVGEDTVDEEEEPVTEWRRE